jgi:serine/threonine protein kinase
VLPAASPATNFQEIALGKYKLIANLGHGGMADVYLAVAAGPAGVNKLQVVKRLRRECAEDSDYVAMFIDEARLAARLNHPNVVQAFEVGKEAGEYFLAMEYLDGAPLNRILARAKERPAPPGVLLKIVADALAGLHYAHELMDYDGTHLAIVHRDASPHNIFVTFDGQTKVVDFGIAKAATRSNETRTGVVKGKVTYMAPEQARCRPLDRRADIFVLGIVLWEVVAGRKMWERSSEADVFHRVLEGTLPNLSELRPDVPAPLARICDRALKADPAERYATAAEMRADILAHMNQAGIRVSTEEVGAYLIELFSDKREEIKKIIERQLSKLSALEIDTLPEISGPESTSLPNLEGVGSGPISANSGRATGRMNGPSSGPSSGPVSGPVTSPTQSNRTLKSVPTSAAATQILVPSEAPAPAQPNRRPLIAACLAFVITTGVAVFILQKRAPARAASTEEAAGTTQSAVALAPPPAPSPSPSPSSDAPAEPPGAAAAVPNGTMIELKVRSSPRSAELFLDGARLPSNPFTGKFPADGVGHRLHAEAEDYRTAAKIIVFDRDASVDIALEPKKGVVARSGSRSSEQEQPKAEEPAAAPVAAAPASQEPSLTATKQGKPKRQLDSSEPWATPSSTAGAAKPKRPLSSSPW